MNIEQTRDSLESLVNSQDGSVRYWDAYQDLTRFINEVEQLLKHNSIKQTAALFKEKK